MANDNLIRKNELLRVLCANCRTAALGVRCATPCSAYTLTEEAFTVEAEPVRHGRWIFYSKASLGGYNVWMCSECDTSYNYVECMNYCPNCGAKMEAKK